MKEFARKYFDLLNGEYSGINLTRINEFDDFYNKQILDSVLPLEQSTHFKELVAKNEYLVDVGFGGGFPILPLAYKLAANKFVGIETRGKKVNVVSEIANKLELENVVLFHSRIENIFFDVNCTVTFKAVGKVYDFLSKINPGADLVVYFYKGPGFYELEKEQLKMAREDWEIVCEEELFVPGTEKRILIGFKNKTVLRGTNVSKHLVKLSDIK